MWRCDWIPSLHGAVPNCANLKCRVKEPAPNKSDSGCGGATGFPLYTRCDWIPSLHGAVPNCANLKCRVKEPAPNKSDSGCGGATGFPLWCCAKLCKPQV
ncbi:hypothetical protein J6590_070624 [Homalodisca vitripennis]|nr:hypothetical protein J6590_070624 [Homalodisca vitripennis]